MKAFFGNGGDVEIEGGEMEGARQAWMEEGREE